MEQKIFKLIYEDHKVGDKEFTKVKMLVQIENLTDELIREFANVKATPGFKINFRFNEKSHILAYPIRSNNGEKVYRPMNDYKSNNPEEERKMVEFGGDSFRNVLKSDPNYEDKIHLKDCICFYESTKLCFTIPIERIVEI